MSQSETRTNAERRVRRGDLVGAVHVLLADLALLANDDDRLEAALLCAIAGFTRQAGALALTVARARDSRFAFVRAATELSARAWPRALVRFIDACVQLKAAPCITAAAHAYVGRWCLVDGEHEAALSHLLHARTLLNEDATGLVRRIDLLLTMLHQERGDDEAASNAFARGAHDDGGWLWPLLAAATARSTLPDPHPCATFESDRYAALVGSGRADDALFYASAWLSNGSAAHEHVDAHLSLLARAEYEPLLHPEFALLIASTGAIAQASAVVETFVGLASRTNARAARAYAQLIGAVLRSRLKRDEGGARELAVAAHEFRALGLRRGERLALDRMLHTQPALQPVRGSRTMLTTRQQQVVAMLRRGASNREIAESLSISEHTVERHITAILTRLSLRSRWQLFEDEREQILSKR